MSTSSTNTCDSALDELPDTRNDENEASRSIKEPVAELRSTANKCTQKSTGVLPAEVKVHNMNILFKHSIDVLRGIAG